MARTIWKYPLVIKNRQTLALPKDWELVTVDKQAGEVFLWALVDPEEPKEEAVIRCFGTGHPIPEESDTGIYMGTVLTVGDTLVWHFYLE